jgi:hypothetical protein
MIRQKFCVYGAYDISVLCVSVRLSNTLSKSLHHLETTALCWPTNVLAVYCCLRSQTSLKVLLWSP